MCPNCTLYCIYIKDIHRISVKFGFREQTGFKLSVPFLGSDLLDNILNSKTFTRHRKKIKFESVSGISVSTDFYSKSHISVKQVILLTQD